MEKNKKYALLDTDFIYKCHLARNFKEDTLAELVLDFEEYEFFCHEMIKEELSRKEIDPNPNPWLELKVQTGKIRLYSDQDIVNELSKIYGELATLMYVNLLQNSCDTFNEGFFSQYYSALEYAENITDLDDFLTALKTCDAKVPPQNGLGEKKTYVLIQMLEILYNERVDVFCSDDFKARQSVASLKKPIKCISILGVFYKLMQMGHEKMEMQEYYTRLSAFLKNQTEYKVWSLSGQQRIKVPIMQVLEDIYDGKFQLLGNGDLRYIK